jgi:hypothetical protein
MTWNVLLKCVHGFTVATMHAPVAVGTTSHMPTCTKPCGLNSLHAVDVIIMCVVG